MSEEKYYIVPLPYVKAYDEFGEVTETTTNQEDAVSFDSEEEMEAALELINGNPDANRGIIANEVAAKLGPGGSSNPVGGVRPKKP